MIWLNYHYTQLSGNNIIPSFITEWTAKKHMMKLNIMKVTMNPPHTHSIEHLP
jgi:hypothetical protein